VLAEPALSLTDLALGAITLLLWARLPATTGRRWRAAFLWFGGAALAGAVHHGVIMHRPDIGDVSWALISCGVVVAISFMLAATIEDVLGPGRWRAFWLLRSIGLIAYAIVAAAGHAGIGAILACESLTMASILGLWGWAGWHRHPRAPAVIVAMLASGAAAAAQAVDPDALAPVGLDPVSLYHLAQIPGMVLLFVAVSREGNRAPGATIVA
jgi:hypothetical protein